MVVLKVGNGAVTVWCITIWCIMCIAIWCITITYGASRCPGRGRYDSTNVLCKVTIPPVYTVDGVALYSPGKMRSCTVCPGPAARGRTVGRPSRFPMQINLPWRFCMGAQGA